MNHEIDLKVERDSADAGPDFKRALFRETGVAFSKDEPEKIAKAEPVPIHPGMTVAEAVDTIVRSCIQHFQVNATIVARRRDAGALHQMRVSMRRLRAALSLFRPALGDAQFEPLREELRWFTSQLGEARNLDVFLIRKGLPKSMRAAIKSEREDAYGRIIAALQSKRLRLLLSNLAQWVEVGRWRKNPKASRPLPDFVARRLYKWWQTVAHHGALKSMHANERHDLRIEIKKLRYALDFVLPLHAVAGRKQKQFYKSVESLQESLGKLNDLATARALWRRFGHKLPRSKSQEQEIEEKCLRAAQASFDRIKKIGPYWTRMA